jgi:hypothetical protein
MLSFIIYSDCLQYYIGYIYTYKGEIPHVNSVVPISFTIHKMWDHQISFPLIYYNGGELIIINEYGNKNIPYYRSIGWRSNYQEVSVVIPFTGFNSTTCLYLSHARTWIPNVICHGFFYVRWVEEIGDFFVLLILVELFTITV